MAVVLLCFGTSRSWLAKLRSKPAIPPDLQVHKQTVWQCSDKKTKKSNKSNGKKLQGARHLLLRHVWGCRPGIVKQLHGSYMSFTRKEQTQSASVQSKSEGMSTVAILSCQTFVPLPEHSIVEMNWMIFIGKLMDFRWHWRKKMKESSNWKLLIVITAVSQLWPSEFPWVQLPARNCMTSRHSLGIFPLQLSQCHNYMCFCRVELNHTSIIMLSYFYVARYTVAVFSCLPLCRASSPVSVPLGFANWSRGRASLTETLAAREGKTHPSTRDARKYMKYMKQDRKYMEILGMMRIWF